MRRGMKFALAGALALGGVAGCGHGNTTMPLTVSPQMPAARGEVTLDKQDGPEQKLTVKVEHLAEPSRTNPNATVYVVWMVPQGTYNPQNIGVLSVNKDLKGTLETQTPYKSFQIFVTPEQTASVTTPSNQQIMQAQVQAGQRTVR